MNFTEMLLKRESCRSFDGSRSVKREDLIKIVEAARLSPSGCNSQPWKFIVVDSPEAKAKLCDALVVLDGKTGCPWRNDVSAFIIAVEEPAKLMQLALDYYNDSQRFAQGDMGMAVLNMCYAADSLGISSCILGLHDQSKLEEYFNIPSGRPVRMVLALGYSKTPDAPPRRKVRKEFEEICSFNQW